MKLLILSTGLMLGVITAKAQNSLRVNYRTAVVASPAFQAPAFSQEGQSVQKYVQTRLNYPDLARNYGIEGEVVLMIRLLENGKVDSVAVAKGIGYGCDEEALRLVYEMPDWQPAILNGIPQASTVKLKVRFRLF